MKITRQRLKKINPRLHPTLGNVDSLYAEPVEGQRVAKCTSCGLISNSQDDLPFFQPTPEKDYDLYYCGCRGWS
jgi:hypothetical protein